MAPVLESFAVPPLGCNCTVAGDTESGCAVVVDPGGDVDVIVRKLREHGLALKQILVTHGHLDHILGAEELKKRCPHAALVMHQDDLSLYENVAGQCEDFGVQPPPRALPRPDAFVADNDTCRLAGGLCYKAVHCPGHTPGSTSYVFEDQRCVCVGDTLFRGSVGRTEWTGLPSLEGTSDQRQLVGSIRNKLYALDADLHVVCGHGSTTTIGAEAKSNMFVRA